MRYATFILCAILVACTQSSPLGVDGLDDGVMLSGQVLGQFDGLPVAGVRVVYQKQSATTDQHGRFTIPGEPVTRDRPLTLSKSGIVNRRTYARTGDDLWKVLPADFNMAAFEDIGRAYTTGTIRWVKPPKVYIDTNRHCFSGGAPQTWAEESRGQAKAFVEAWTAGTASPQVVVTSNPPDDFTAGTIVVHFSECSGDVGQFIGLARVSWNRRNEINAASIYMRFKKYRNDPGKRKGILGHELGHAHGYRHVFEKVPSLMQASLGSKTDLKPFDHLAARFQYGRVPKNVTPDTDGRYSKSISLAAGGYWEGF